MQKKKILIEAGPMADTKKTGVGYYVDGLIKSLASQYGNELDMEGYYFNFLGMNPETLPKLQGMRFRRIWLIPGKLLSICRRLGFQPFLDIFTSTKADVILFTNYVALPLLRRRQKMALAIYDLSFLDHPQYMQSVNLKYLSKFCPPSIRRANTIITISEFTKQRLLHHFPGLTAPIVVTPIPPIGQPVKDTPLSERLERLGVTSGHYLLYLGTIEPRKNLQALVQAYGLMGKNVRANYALVLAGGKGWKDEAILDEVARLQASGANIVMPGYISDEEKAALYSHAACFVLPSHYEGFGMPILEAMQYGLPVAASDIPVFHEVAGKGAVYFNKDEPKDIASKLTSLLTDPLLHKATSTAGAAQLKSFSWEENARLVYEALTQ